VPFSTVIYTIEEDIAVSKTLTRRVIVIGSSNSGKSTLAEWLAARIGARFIELDALNWEPNWVIAETEIFRERVRRAIACDSWVIAGNYSTQQGISWPLADTIIWLDLPLRTVLRRCVVRTCQRYRSQELLWGTNRENFWEHLMLWDQNKSLFTYTLVNHRSKRKRFQAEMRDPRWSHITFVRLRSTKEVEEWKAHLEDHTVLGPARSPAIGSSETHNLPGND
jgi:adenylate kinase family enzyme